MNFGEDIDRSDTPPLDGVSDSLPEVTFPHPKWIGLKELM